MLKLTGTITLSAALSAAVLLSTATSQPVGTTPIVTGHGAFEAPVGTIGFEVSLVELPDGSLEGHGMSYLHGEGGNGWFHFEVTEYLFVGEELFVAGLITDTFNTPPDFLGSLTVLAIQDNGSGGAPPDRAISASGLPPFLTLEDIVTAPPPFGPPPSEDWFPLTSGDFQIH